jgi:hypothetical protein
MKNEKTIKYVIRTKKQIVDAMAVGNITISNEVISNPDFKSMDKNELLGFKLIGKGDFEVVEFYDIKNNHDNFKKVLFGYGDNKDKCFGVGLGEYIKKRLPNCPNMDNFIKIARERLCK